MIFFSYYTRAYDPMHVGRDERFPISLYKKNTPTIVSSEK